MRRLTEVWLNKFHFWTSPSLVLCTQRTKKSESLHLYLSSSKLCAGWGFKISRSSSLLFNVVYKHGHFPLGQFCGTNDHRSSAQCLCSGQTWLMPLNQQLAACSWELITQSGSVPCEEACDWTSSVPERRHREKMRSLTLVLVFSTTFIKVRDLIMKFNFKRWEVIYAKRKLFFFCLTCRGRTERDVIHLGMSDFITSRVVKTQTDKNVWVGCQRNTEDNNLTLCLLLLF